MSFSSAYLLVSHGSRDPRPQLAVEQLAQLLSDKLGSTQNNLVRSHQPSGQLASMTVTSIWYPQVGTATLELAPFPLREQIRLFGDRALIAGCRNLEILPLFLLPGVHVMEDIPQEIAQAQINFGHALKMTQRPYLGSHPQLKNLLAKQQKQLTADAWILLSHGTSRTGGNQPVEEIARQLGAVAAYWSIEPSLTTTIAELASQGHRQIGILPYFLFTGAIIEAIAQNVRQLQTQFPAIELQLSSPIDTSNELADLVLDLVH